MKREVVRKIIAGLIFGLTAMFFVVSYFGMTTSGEDLFQGAGTTPEVWKDMTAAFQYDGRIPDMYAWTVINFFDYQYSFGIDTIFRLLDVAMGMGLLYLMVYIALGRRLKFELKDATLWAIGFILLFLTQHGQALYHGFSLIHNYLLIVLITLGFGMWYLKRARGEELQDSVGRGMGMLILGVLFGLSSNLTPAAFLVTFVGVMVVKMVRERKIWVVLRKVRAWEILGVVGVLLGMAVAYIGGPGVSSYLNDDSYVIGCDYVSFGDIWMDPVTSFLRLAKHAVRNGALVVLPIVIILAVFAGVRLIRMFHKKKQKLVWWPENKGKRTVLVVLASFMVVHILAATQLVAPLRLLLPAYVSGIIIVMILVKEWTQGWKMWGVGIGALIVVLGVVVVRAVLVMEYHAQAGRVLKKIQESGEEVVCVMPAEVQSRKLPIISLGQDNMLVDWALPTTIYGKKVVWCGSE